MSKTPITDELRQKARELRVGGASYSDIAKELGIASSTAYKIAGDVLPPESEEVEFLDSESRLLRLLKSYNLKNPETVVAYISTQGEGIYSDLAGLKRCLVDQGVPVGRVGALIRHYAGQEGITIPHALESELATESQTTPLPSQRFSLVGGHIVADPSGLPYLQCLQELEVRLNAQAKPSGDSEALRELKQEMKQLREDTTKQQISSLQQQLQMQAQAHADQMRELTDRLDREKVGRTEMDIIQSVADGVLGEGKAWRTLAEKAVVEGNRLPAMKTPQERDSRKIRYRGAIQADKEMDALGRKIFFGEEMSAEMQQRIYSHKHPGMKPPSPLPPAPQTFE